MFILVWDNIDMNEDAFSDLSSDCEIVWAQIKLSDTQLLNIASPLSIGLLTLKNILDLILTNQPSKVTETKSLPGMSDHNIVLTLFKLNYYLHQTPPAYGAQV